MEKCYTIMMSSIMAGDVEEKASAGGRASCDFPAIFMKRSNSSMLMMTESEDNRAGVKCKSSGMA